tara:strand:- start:56 stop:601 length:546 start_codon:yes stop_codon:yes gene_type:complete
MSTALQFTSVFDPQRPPEKLNIGGMRMRPKPVTESRSLPVAASKALEARGIKTPAIKDLETPPPVSVADATKPSLPSPRFQEKLDNLTEEQKTQLEQFFKQLFLLEELERNMPNKDLRDDMLRDNLQDIYNRQFGERLQAKAMSPDMNMIMRAQNDQSGINAVVNDSPIAQLRMMDYNGIV